MPLKLIAPSTRSKFYRVRGTLHGVHMDRTTETADQRKARAILKRWETDILSGVISGKRELTFAGAAEAYVGAGGDGRFIPRLVKYFGPSLAAADITQALVDRAACDLHPDASPATRNRQVYTPVSAVLRHVHVNASINRPKGAQGQQRTRFLTIEEFDRLEATTAEKEPELAALFTLLAYTGLRLSEALSIERSDMELQEGRAFVRKTKNGEPRMVHLPQRAVVAIANVPKLTGRHDRLFRWSKSGMLYVLAELAYADAGVDHGGAPFHVLRHTYGRWMTQIGADLVGTKVWKSPSAARGYQHFVVSEEAAKADLLPGARRVK